VLGCPFVGLVILKIILIDGKSGAAEFLEHRPAREICAVALAGMEWAVSAA